METLQSETKKRVLPSWLTAQVAAKNVAPVKAPKRRRMAAVPVAAARLPATRTVYCMNEAEIVDVALGILIELILMSLPASLPSGSWFLQELRRGGQGLEWGEERVGTQDMGALPGLVTLALLLDISYITDRQISMLRK
nr:modulator of retrovirus infection homolog isoform X2 [Aotus nancymaae]